MTASIPLLILLSRTRLHALWKNARFRCKIPVFCVGCNTPQGPLSGHPCRTNRPARRSFSSAPSYDLLSTSPYLIVKHRLANLSEKCKISMQDKRIQPETIPRENPAVTPFAADELASGLQTFECDLFDLLSNAPYEIVMQARRVGYLRSPTTPYYTKKFPARQEKFDAPGFYSSTISQCHSLSPAWIA